jgi:hypothetical protein
VQEGECAPNTAEQITKVKDEELPAEVLSKLEREPLSRDEAKAVVEESLNARGVIVPASNLARALSAK